MSARWRVLLLLCLLLALPLKGLAAVGLHACAADAGLAQTHGHPCVDCPDGVADTAHHDDGDEGGASGQHHGSPCCLNLATAPTAPVLGAAPPVLARTAGQHQPIRSADPQGLLRPPRV